MYLNYIFLLLLKILDINSAKPLSFGHRGASGYNPENTLISFKDCLEEYDSNIELDIQITKDKSVLILHDNTVDRTTNGTGEINNLVLDYVKSLDAGFWYSNEFVGEKVPLFKDVLSLLENYPDKRVIVDTKRIGNSILYGLSKEINSSNIDASNFLLGCWNFDCIDEAKMVMPYGIKYIFIGDPPKLESLSEYSKRGFDILSLNFKLLDESWLYFVRRSYNFTIFTWTLNDRSNISRAIDFGVDGIISNYPDLINA